MASDYVFKIRNAGEKKTFKVTIFAASVGDAEIEVARVLVEGQTVVDLVGAVGYFSDVLQGRTRTPCGPHRQEGGRGFLHHDKKLAT